MSSVPTFRANGGWRRSSSRPDLAMIATRMLGTPLAVASSKLDVIVAAIGPRLGLRGVPAAADILLDASSGAGPEVQTDVTPDGLAIVSVAGTLVYKSAYLGALSGLVSYGAIVDAVAAAAASPRVQGILLEIDSFGGEVAGMLDVVDAVRAAAGDKPLHAVAADTALSAGYMIAAAADHITVSQTGLLGSIGIVAVHVDQSGADSAAGVNYSYVHSGARKIDGHPHSPLTDGARAALQADVDALQKTFAGAVARRRGVSTGAILSQQAAIYRGRAGVSAKLADALGTKDDALATLGRAVAQRETSAAGGDDTQASAPPVKRSVAESWRMALAKVQRSG